ncbi:MAG TPA: S8 family serine peptidase [Gemmatimonadaceae bacterium]|nr:S8 family serine peptidase [Gemmatimonadaceae bacterium]
MSSWNAWLRRTSLRVVLVGGAFGLLACEREPLPVAPSMAGNIASSPVASAPFYYYEGQKIYVEVDPSRLVVDDGDGDPRRMAQMTPQQIAFAGEQVVRSAQDVLTPLGISVDTSHALIQMAGHWVMHLRTVPGAASMRVARDNLVSSGRFRFAAPAYRFPGSGGDYLLVNRLSVRFKESASRAQIDSLARAHHLTLIRPARPDSGVSWYSYRYPADLGLDALALVARLNENALVEWAEPDNIADVQPTAVPTDPFYSQQYYLRNTNVAFNVRVDDNVESAWDLNRGGGVPSLGGMTIAIIDDGVQAAHPDFAGHVAFGWDVFPGADNTLGCTDCAWNPAGNYSHGTLVAGLIIGQHNGSGMAGIAPDAQVVPIRIFHGFTAAAAGDIASGIGFAWSVAGAQILSNSWGVSDPNYRSPAITDAINAATTQGRGGKGALVVFSAGNTSDRAHGIYGPVLYPALLASTVSVGAINRSGGLTNYTPQTGRIDIVAPSGHITNQCVGDVITTDLLGTRGCNDGPSGNIDYSGTFSGTSAAAPQVAAVGALLLTKDRTLTLSQVKTRLFSGADPWGGTAQVGAGKLNAYHTLVPRVVVGISGPNIVSSPGTYTWTASASGGVGGYGYRWDTSTDGVNFSDTGARTSSYTRSVGQSDFYLRATVTSGPDQGSTTKFIIVTSCDAVAATASASALIPPC